MSDTSFLKRLIYVERFQKRRTTMGRFEKKIHKKIQAEQENFDVWFEKHSELLHDFQSNDTEEEVQPNGKKN